jgi:Tol biopolymer transport system component
MAVTAPARPLRAPEIDEPEQLEALIKEARRRARLRRLRYATCVVLVASAGSAAVLGPGGGGGAGGPAASEPAPAAGPWEIKLTGARLAYVPEYEQGALYVTKPNGSGASAVAKCGQWVALCVIRDPVWSPDGLRIAFLRGRATENDAGDVELYVIGLNGRGARRLAQCKGNDGGCGSWTWSRPSWSPDGSQIAFSRSGMVSIVDVESGRVRQLTRCAQAPCSDVRPAWSPDQSAIAFTRSTGKAHALYRVSVSGSQLQRLAAEGMNPAWAPDGKTILVETRRGIESIAADGSRRTLIAPGSPAELPTAPSWSPDESRVLYFSFRREQRGFRAEVWSMRPNGSAKRRLYRQPCCLDFVFWSKPVWSADGSRVAFSVYGPRYEVNVAGTFVVDADGTRLRNLTRQRTELAWQPTPVSMEATRR